MGKALLFPEPVIDQHGAGHLGQQSQENTHGNGDGIEYHRSACHGIEGIAGTQADCGNHHDLLDADPTVNTLPEKKDTTIMAAEIMVEFMENA